MSISTESYPMAIGAKKSLAFHLIKIYKLKLIAQKMNHYK